MESNEYKPITKKEALESLASRFGGVSVARMILDNAISDAQHMGIGMDDNNPLKMASTFESLYDNLMKLRTLFDKKENRPPLDHAIKDAVSE